METRASTGEPCAPDFVYTIFIKATAEQVWNGLIDRGLTKTYWGHYNESDWQPGSRWNHVRSDDNGTIDTCGRIVEIQPPHKMIWTWSFVKEADSPATISRVIYELTPLGPDTKLTVTHSELEPGSRIDTGVRDGWPAVLSNLKSILETGTVLSEELWPENYGQYLFDRKVAKRAPPVQSSHICVQ
ncbi:SRPBCC family protein [Parasphingorhabdus sp.]|uniref:SRPBCC family protein n=1 Tax=Parasphingorhabdus sp. TaxID=2709688 RepID=UPI0030A4D5C1